MKKIMVVLSMLIGFGVASSGFAQGKDAVLAKVKGTYLGSANNYSGCMAKKYRDGRFQLIGDQESRMLGMLNTYVNQQGMQEGDVYRVSVNDSVNGKTSVVEIDAQGKVYPLTPDAHQRECMLFCALKFNPDLISYKK